jgi:hypothetical protein
VSRSPCVAALKRLNSGLHSHTRHQHENDKKITKKLRSWVRVQKLSLGMTKLKPGNLLEPGKRAGVGSQAFQPAHQPSIQTKITLPDVPVTEPSSDRTEQSRAPVQIFGSRRPARGPAGIEMAYARPGPDVLQGRPARPGSDSGASRTARARPARMAGCGFRISRVAWRGYAARAHAGGSCPRG